MVFDVTPVKKELNVKKGLEEVRLVILKQLETMKGKIVKSEIDYIESDFGSLFNSRIIGEFWVSKKTLPKKTHIHLVRVDNNNTRVEIIIVDTHKYGTKVGYVKKYENALEELADSIIEAIKF